MRQPERDARQTGCADVAATDGGSIDVHELRDDEIERVDAVLPLARLDVVQTYLVGWDAENPIGHLHIAWTNTKLGVPDIQDVFVLPERRREGIATRLMEAAEECARARGCPRVSIGHSTENEAARRLYMQLGYRDAGIAPERVLETITIRGEPVDIDDTIVYLVKDL